MASTTSPNMNLTVPTVGVEPGPDWASDINGDLGIIDSHNHSSGQGVQITPNGLNINTDLTFQDNNATFMRSVRFASNLTPISGVLDVGCIYEAGVDLWYNDGAGNQIRLTQSGSIVGTSGSITGLVPPASASYSVIGESFIWQSAVNTPAFMDSGPLIIRDLVVNSFGLTLQPPSLAGDYTITLPLLPAQQSFMTLDAAGNMAAPWTVDNSTIKITANQLVAQPAALTQGEHAWELNGKYSSLTFPLTNIDAIFFAPYNITIQSVWIYNGTAGTSGTTEYDIRVASPGGSFTTILSTTGKIASSATSNIWTDSGSVVGSQTGVTKPVVSVTAILAGKAIEFNILQTMAGSPTDARIRIFYSKT